MVKAVLGGSGWDLLNKQFVIDEIIGLAKKSRREAEERRAQDDSDRFKSAYNKHVGRFREERDRSRSRSRGGSPSRTKSASSMAPESFLSRLTSPLNADLAAEGDSEEDDNNGDAIIVLYIGAASYDNVSNKEAQTKLLQESGCVIKSLNIAIRDLSKRTMQAKVNSADVILFSGGNTLFAMDRCKATGLDEIIRSAAKSGKVLCGGSAGANIYFDGCHSDSANPMSVKNPKPNLSDEKKHSWPYICVRGLGIFHGILSPHFDKMRESDGLVRCVDADVLLATHCRNETIIGLDHFAALVVDGSKYKVIAVSGEGG